MARNALLLLVVALSSPAFADRDDPTAELNPERDALLDRIATGKDAASAVKKFALLLDRREQVTAAALAAASAQRAARTAVDESLDARIESTSCEIAIDPPDPTKKRRSRDGGMAKVVRRGELRLAPKNDLDPGEVLKFIELDQDGVLIHLRLEKPSSLDKAAPGDKAFLCGVSTVNRREYGEWGIGFAYVGWAARVAAPPTVMKYAAQQPAFVPTRTLDHALRDIKWPYKGQKVFLRVHLADSVSPHRWRVMSGNADFLLDVPPSTPGAKHIASGKAPWVLAEGQFDPDTRKLLLRALSIEERLLTEK